MVLWRICIPKRRFVAHCQGGPGRFYLNAGVSRLETGVQVAALDPEHCRSCGSWASGSDPAGPWHGPLLETYLKLFRVEAVTANDVDAALAAPMDEVGARLAAIAEDQWFERKSIKIQAKDLGRPLVALANAEGGVIVVGIAAGQVEGLRNHSSKLNAFRQAPMDFTVPPV